MKKYLILISYITIGFVNTSKAQLSNTEAKKFFETQIKEAHDMFADKNDSWDVVSRRDNEFDIFSKEHFVDSLHKPKNIGWGSFFGDAGLLKLNTVKSIELAVPNINPQNAANYLYHVVVNDSVELVHWMKPNIFRSNKYASYAYLGKYDCLGKIIKFEIYDINNYRHKTTILINGGYMRAPDINFVSLSYNNKYLFLPEKQEYIPRSKQVYFEDHSWRNNPIRFRWSDSINHIAVIMKNTLENDIYHLYLKKTINGKTDTVFITNTWNADYYSPDPTARINSSYFNKPGDYELIIRPEEPEIFKHKNDRIGERVSFTVLPALDTEHNISLKTFLLIIVILLTTGGFMFVTYRSGQKRQLAKEAQNKQIATLQLQSVRAQLNPHFIFNALAGIQNLMNKNAVEDANRYLTRFARLTRNVLDDGQKELTTIEHEAALLNDYLQMEQLRFSFKFNLNTNDVDPQIEIPAMLLQPFVENAVKHGVSALKEQGMITIDITKNENNITLSVNDNGKGFSENKTAGMGIKLCEERIRLLNSIYKNTSILLHKKSDSNGTQITIELNNWLQ